MPLAPPIMVAAFVAFVVVMLVIAAYQRKKRREAMSAWAREHGLSYSPARDPSFDTRYAHFDCLRRGSNRYAFNIIEGLWDGRPLVAFDYHYETHSRDSKGRRRTQHHHFSAVVLEARVPLQPLVIRAENIFDKVSSFFGYDDIDFESAEFSRRFCVKADDRRWAYDVLHARAIEFLLASPRFSIEFDPQRVIAWRSGRFNVADLYAAAGVVDGLLDRLPDYVKQQQLAAP